MGNRILRAFDVALLILFRFSIFVFIFVLVGRIFRGRQEYVFFIKIIISGGASYLISYVLLNSVPRIIMIVASLALYVASICIVFMVP